MYEIVAEVAFIQCILLCAQPCEALPVDKYLQWVDSCQKHVDPHVEFIAVEQERIFQILLKNHWLCKYDLVEAADE